MSASLFDLYVAETCPAEFSAMRAARDKYTDLAIRFLGGDTSVTEAECLAAKDEADRAERAARQAFDRHFRPGAP